MSFQGSGLSFTSFFGEGFKVVEHQNHIFPESGFVPCSIIESSRGSLICVPVTEGVSSDGDSYLTVTEVDVSRNNNYDGSVGELCIQQVECEGESESRLLDQSGEPVDSTSANAPVSPHPQEALPSTHETKITKENEQDHQKIARKGGWPKGKKRKKCLIEVAAPKSPATGYVLFLNSRRKQMKETRPEIPFAEVTKMLGNEWTNLPAQEKKGYLKKAEEEKCRYREELRQYQQSEAYQALTTKKKSTQAEGKDGNASEKNCEKSTTVPIHDIEEEDFRRELYCMVCDKLFNSLHNKREHLYGKQHLSNITGVTHQASSLDKNDAAKKSGKSTGEDLDPEYSSLHFQLRDAITSVSAAMSLVNSLSTERLEEIEYLSQRCGNLRHHKCALEKDIMLLEEVQKKRDKELEIVEEEGRNLSAQLLNLRMVPTLFGIIKF